MLTTSANPNQALWEKGDFTRIAEIMRESQDAFVESLAIKPGMQVLDLACGDGNSAIAAAKRGAVVLGIDIARNLVEAGQRRVRELGLTNCTIEQGDATNLQHLPSQHFDLVITIYGAMFAPRPFDVAKEMVRVTKPGGRIVMANWIPGDPTLASQVFRICSAYTPPPPEGFVSPMLWGVESNVLERFEAAGIPRENISFLKDTITFSAPFPPQEFAGRFKHFFGPVMNAYEAAEKNGVSAKLQQELEELFVQQNKAPDASTTFIQANFLRVTVSLQVFSTGP